MVKKSPRDAVLNLSQLLHAFTGYFPPPILLLLLLLYYYYCVVHENTRGRFGKTQPITVAFVMLRVVEERFRQPGFGGPSNGKYDVRIVAHTLPTKGSIDRRHRRLNRKIRQGRTK